MDRTTTPRGGIDFDAAWFDPQKVMAVRHRWADHPLLQMDSLVQLGKRLGASGSVRYHNADAALGTDFTSAPETHKAKLSIEDTLRDIEKAEAWMALHNIQNDPLYRTLVDEILDEVCPRVQAKDPGMFGRAGWIFVTSPNAVTPYHMDHENNFILQIAGKKTLYVWEPLDREVVTEASKELFHAKFSRELVTYKEEFQSRAHVFEIESGIGAYMPMTAPHAVKNGSGVSITISVTYLTEATCRTELLYRGNYRMRQLGLRPAPVGTSPRREAVVHAALRTAKQGKTMLDVLRGKPLRAKRPAYGVL